MLEDIIQVKEAQLEIDPKLENRAQLSKAEAELKRYIKMEEEFQMQKAVVRLFKQGDKNISFFFMLMFKREGKNCC